MQTSLEGASRARLKSFMSLIITDRKHECSADSILLPFLSPPQGLLPSHRGGFSHLVLHVLQPLQAQVGDDARRPVVNRKNVDLKLLRSSRHNLETSFREVEEFRRQTPFISPLIFRGLSLLRRRSAALRMHKSTLRQQ